jgi:hypothetical protein
VPTNRDHPWLRDARAVRTELDPEDPGHDAALHVSRQLRAIDEAREPTSTAPPPPPAAA